MVDLKAFDIRTIDAAFEAAQGYALNFSDRTMRQFFDDEFHIDIEEQKYFAGGSSKMNRLRTFFRIEEPPGTAPRGTAPPQAPVTNSPMAQA